MSKKPQHRLPLIQNRQLPLTEQLANERTLKSLLRWTQKQNLRRWFH